MDVELDLGELLDEVTHKVMVPENGDDVRSNPGRVREWFHW
jgi:hypothetical protein